MDLDYQQVYLQLADQLNMELSQVSQRFGEICLPKKEQGLWRYHPLLGVFGALE